MLKSLGTVINKGKTKVADVFIINARFQEALYEILTKELKEDEYLFCDVSSKDRTK